MKLPTDEEIKERLLLLFEGKDHDTDNDLYLATFIKRERYLDGCLWMRDQVKPLFDLVEELRKARDQYNRSLEAGLDYTSDLHLCFDKLDDLRDKLELGYEK